jgi:hypothetical protein
VIWSIARAAATPLRFATLTSALQGLSRSLITSVASSGRAHLVEGGRRTTSDSPSRGRLVAGRDRWTSMRWDAGHVGSILSRAGDRLPVWSAAQANASRAMKHRRCLVVADPRHSDPGAIHFQLSPRPRESSPTINTGYGEGRTTKSDTEPRTARRIAPWPREPITMTSAKPTE